MIRNVVYIFYEFSIWSMVMDIHFDNVYFAEIRTCCVEVYKETVYSQVVILDYLFYGHSEANIWNKLSQCEPIRNGNTGQEFRC